MELQIANWPKYKKELEKIEKDLMPKITSRYGEASGGSDKSRRPTEEAAIRLISAQYIAQLDWTVKCIESVYNRLSDENKELIRLRYWVGNLTMDGIAMRMNMGKSTVCFQLNNILVAMASRLGYINLYE